TNYSGFNAADVAVTNTDNDTKGITVTPTTGLTTTEAGGKATFTVVLNTQPTADVTIPLTSSNTAEGTVDKSSLTFTPANWNVAQTVTVTGVDDSVVDGNIAYNIVTAAATSTDTNYSGVNATDVAVTNTDNETAGITVSPTTGLTTTEAGGKATFTVVLNTQPTADVTIPLTSSNIAEGTVDKNSLTFTSANWNQPQTVTVTGVDDTLVD
ncbi:calcium-binding protein, partial [Microcoleus anatoxicus PTRS2]